MKTPLSALTILLAMSNALAMEPADQAAAVAAAIDPPPTCSDPESFMPLFELAASGEISGVETTEDLAEANEAAFLKCPKQFLGALKDQPRATQDGVLNYFGVRTPPWKLGTELRKLKNHPQVGPFVRTRFTMFLQAEEPK